MHGRGRALHRASASAASAPVAFVLYFFRVRTYAGDRYDFSVELMADDYGQSTESHGRIAVGGSVEGRIDWIESHRDYDDLHDDEVSPLEVGRPGLEPGTLRLKVSCSTR